MLHNRQAPGRDFHEHFSLAPARSDTNPPKQPAVRPRPQSPTRQGSSSQCDVESTTPVTHPSHSSRPTPLSPFVTLISDCSSSAAKSNSTLYLVSAIVLTGAHPLTCSTTPPTCRFWRDDNDPTGTPRGGPPGAE